MRHRARHTRPLPDRNQKGKAEADVFLHVAVGLEIQMLVPVAGADQLVMRQIAIHPVARLIVIGEREMRRAIAKRLADRDAFIVQRSVHPADGRLGAFVVNVPALEMLDRAGVHQDQRRMDDRAGVHQGARQRVLDGLDCIGKGLRNDGNGFIGLARGQHTGWQPRSTGRNPNFGLTLLARQPGQSTGLGNGEIGGTARIAHPLHHDVGTECARRQENHLSVGHVGSQFVGNIRLGVGRCRGNNEFGAGHRGGQIIGRHQFDRPAALVIGHDHAAGLRHLCKVTGVAPPPAHIVTRLGKIGRRRVGPVTAADYNNLHSIHPGKHNLSFTGQNPRCANRHLQQIEKPHANRVAPASPLWQTVMRELLYAYANILTVALIRYIHPNRSV